MVGHEMGRIKTPGTLAFSNTIRNDNSINVEGPAMAIANSPTPDRWQSKDNVTLGAEEGAIVRRGISVARAADMDRDLILRDDALLYIAYVMLIWVPLIPATRWNCNRPPADSNDS